MSYSIFIGNLIKTWSCSGIFSGTWACYEVCDHSSHQCYPAANVWVCMRLHVFTCVYLWWSQWNNTAFVNLFVQLFPAKTQPLHYPLKKVRIFCDWSEVIRVQSSIFLCHLCSVDLVQTFAAQPQHTYCKHAFMRTEDSPHLLAPCPGLCWDKSAVHIKQRPRTVWVVVPGKSRKN